MMPLGLLIGRQTRIQAELASDDESDQLKTEISTVKACIEVRDLGSGRSDISFQYNGIKTVAELKKTESNYDAEGLVKEFGLQATAYQVTNVTLGILMVLDLADRDGGTPHLREQVSFHEKIPEWDKTAYSIVLFRVQGRRRPPCKLNP